jgi:hypothetical protein
MSGPVGKSARVGPLAPWWTAVSVASVCLLLTAAARATPWPGLPPADTRIERIAFGSCLHQGTPQPIWNAVRARAPQVMVGDSASAMNMPPQGEAQDARVDPQVGGPVRSENVGLIDRDRARPTLVLSLIGIDRATLLLREVSF